MQNRKNIYTVASIWRENMHGYLSAELSVPRSEQFSESGSKLEENCELRGTDNIQSQISVQIFEAKWRLLYLLSFKYLFTRQHFGRPFLKAFKHQRNSVSAQNIISRFKCLVLFILTTYSR